eukprot:1346131-Amphidinium_carterae.1
MPLKGAAFARYEKQKKDVLACPSVPNLVQVNQYESLEQKQLKAIHAIDARWMPTGVVTISAGKTQLLLLPSKVLYDFGCAHLCEELSFVCHSVRTSCLYEEGA